MCSHAVHDYKSGTCLASLRLCPSPLQECVALFKHKKPRVFHRDWLFANVCDRLWEVPEISVWGNRKKHCFRLIVRGCCPARDQLALCLQRTEQRKKTFFLIFFYGRMILHRDISNVSAHQHIYSKPFGFMPYGKNIHTGSKRAFKCVKSGRVWIEQTGDVRGIIMECELTCKGQSFKWCDTWTLTSPQHNKMQGCVPSISKGWNKS